MCTQSVQMNPTTTVPTAPNNRPEFLNAMGIAKIPVPKELFSRCIKEPVVLYRRMRSIVNSFQIKCDAKLYLRTWFLHLAVLERIVIIVRVEMFFISFFCELSPDKL